MMKTKDIKVKKSVARFAKSAKSAMTLSFFGAALLPFSVLALSACGGVGSQEDSTAAQVMRDSQKIEARFTIAAGTYKGQISNPATGFSPMNATLYLYIVKIVDGKFADGSSKIRPELRARFRLDDLPTPTDVTTMVGDYDSSGKISFASSTTEPNPLELSGQMLGRQISVDVSRQGGVWGTFTGPQVSNTSAAPAEGYLQEEYRRYRALYHTIEGTYTATIKVPGGKGYGIEITVTQNDIPEVGVNGAAGNALVPSVSAFYRRLDVIQGEHIGEYTLRVDYNGFTHTAFMQSISPDKASIPGSSQLSVRGTIIHGELKAQVSNKTGYIGDIIAKAKNVPPLR